MPKQMLNIPSFGGGLNTALDPRDIKPSELSKANNVMFDINGIIRCQGKGVSIEDNILNVPITSLSHGYGLSTFESSYNSGVNGQHSTTFGASSDYEGSELYSHNGMDAEENSDTGAYWYMMSNAVSEIFVKSESEASWGELITLTDDSENVLKSIYHKADEGVRISNAELKFKYITKNKWFGFIKKTNFFTGATNSTDYNFNGWYVLDNDIKKPTELDFIGQGDTPVDGPAGNGTGFEMKIFATTGGSIDFSEDLDSSENLKYDFASTFIYDGIQESLPFESEDKEVLDATGNDIVDTDNALNITIAVKTGFNPRITGGRIYYKKATSNDDYVLLCDIDFEKGLRASLDNTYADGSWTVVSGSGTNVTIKSNAVVLTSKNLDTYSSLTEWGARESRISIGCTGDNYPADSNLGNAKISEGYKCSTIVNRRAFIANCKLYHNETSGVASGDSARERDRIYYSGMCSRNGVNFEAAFDCFPRSNYIDLVKGDAEEYTALVGYADRLLAFKTNTIFVINVAGEPSEWFLESQHTGMGVLRPCQVTKSEDGVMWANKNGAYVYTGGEVRTTTAEDISFGADIKNLSRDKIAKRDWIQSENSMCVGYITRRQQLVIIDNTENGNAATGYIYDFNTNTWSKSGQNVILIESGTTGAITNFTINENSDLIWCSLADITPGTQLVVNGSFSQDVADGTDGFMNDDNGEDGYGQTVDGYTGTIVSGSDNQRVYVWESNTGRRLWHKIESPSDSNAINGHLDYTIPTSLSAGGTYNISVDYDIGGLLVQLYIYKSGSEASTIVNLDEHNLYDDYESLGTLSGSYLVEAGAGGSYVVRLKYTGVASNSAKSGWNNLSVKNMNFDEGATGKFYSFGNDNTIIGADEVNRFNMPENSIDIRTKDTDFGQTGLKKRIYAVYVTYRTETAGQTAPISYALDGASAYNNDSSNWTNLTGNMSDTSGAWTVGKFKSDSPLTCQSLRLKVTNPSEGIIEINDIAVEHRITGRKVA